MASRTAAANALMRHEDLKAAARGQPEPPPMASASSQGLGTAALLRPVPKTKQLRNVESMDTVPEWLAQLLGEATIDLTCRAQRACENIGKCRLGRGVIPARICMLAHR